MNYVINYIGEGNMPHHFYLLNQTNPINTTDVTQYIKFAFQESVVESLNIEEFKLGEYVLCFTISTTDDTTRTYEKVCNADNMQSHISEFITKYPNGTFECEHYSSFEEEWKQESINYSAFTSIPECCRTCMYVEFPYYWSDRDETSMFCVLHASKITEDLIHNCEELNY